MLGETGKDDESGGVRSFRPLLDSQAARALASDAAARRPREDFEMRTIRDPRDDSTDRDETNQ